MRTVPLIGIASVLFISLIVLLFSSCKTELERRRLHTLERLHWSGGTENQRRVRDALSNAVASSTVRSLATPLLVDASLWVGSQERTNGFLKVDWCSEASKADGLVILFDDSTQIRASFKQADVDENGKSSKELVIFNGVIHQEDAPEIWAGIAPTTHPRVFLAADGKPVSNTLSVRFISRLP